MALQLVVKGQKERINNVQGFDFFNQIKYNIQSFFPPARKLTLSCDFFFHIYLLICH